MFSTVGLCQKGIGLLAFGFSRTYAMLSKVSHSQCVGLLASGSGLGGHRAFPLPTVTTSSRELFAPSKKTTLASTISTSAAADVDAVSSPELSKKEAIFDWNKQVRLACPLETAPPEGAVCRG